MRRGEPAAAGKPGVAGKLALVTDGGPSFLRINKRTHSQMLCC